MDKKKIIVVLSVLLAVLVCFSAGMGLFYKDYGQTRLVENIYGEKITLFGNGVYANNSMLKATTAKGTDLVMIFVSIALVITTVKRNKGPRVKILHGGLLFSLLYYAANMALGITYNKLFLLYLTMFSVAFFATIFTLLELYETIKPTITSKNFIGTAVFTMVSGCTVLVWLMSILPTIFTDAPMDIISIYTTEPTFVIDIGLIFPTCIISGVMLLRKKIMGYILSPIMLIFLAVIAVTVVGQTALQIQYGVVISISQVIGYVVTFVVFGIIAVVVNTFFLYRCYSASE